MSDQEKITMPETPGEVHHSHIGPILGVLVVVLVLILGGLYLWGASLSEEQSSQRQIENNEPETPRANADIAILGTLSPSDELIAIEADLGSTNIEDIDASLNEIDNELESALGGN